jgi:predicted nuclease of restriction endonuclease-like (RecB) superfamily
MKDKPKKKIVLKIDETQSSDKNILTEIDSLPDSSELSKQVCQLIMKTKDELALMVSNKLVLLYWNIGKLISYHILKGKRADYGEQTIVILSQSLTQTYGKGFTVSSLNRMVNFYQFFQKYKEVEILSKELSWSHFVEFLNIKDEIARAYYIEICRIERWSVRQLRERLDTMLFERTAISKKPKKLIKSELKSLRENKTITPDFIFRDPYVLNFLGLKDIYSEKDLESAIISELAKFITELGNDFAFLAQQKKIIIDNEDYNIDLLFYHRKLKRLIAIDLKLGKFKAEYKGKMELYLNWLNEYEKSPGEDEPMGIILCTEKSEEQIRLLKLNKGNIRVSQYLTALPPKDLMVSKLHQAVQFAQNMLQERQSDYYNSINIGKAIEEEI